MLYESENNRDKGVERLTAQLFRIFPWIASGPQAKKEPILYKWGLGLSPSCSMRSIFVAVNTWSASVTSCDAKFQLIFDDGYRWWSTCKKLWGVVWQLQLFDAKLHDESSQKTVHIEITNLNPWRPTLTPILGPNFHWTRDQQISGISSLYIAHKSMKLSD